ncbi:MAG: hypothetical protein A2X35_09485 [Elusimicrobia bacterium GWA2_61_42]|nr:MAG: hypothetical protein A2X35_09485 [Elusimicrobia bacterium GWA2_61_42]OGR74921.1 MAG: hypothetical protein A2X38_05695 [Elusimicrobia bacterium GWC2_61_25]
MNSVRLKPGYLILLAACLAAAAAPAREWERALYGAPPGGFLLRAQSSADGEESGEEEYTSRETRTEAGTSQKIFREGSALKAEYRFINFNKDRLGISFGMPGAEYRRYAAGYGYHDEDLDILKAWREKARQSAWKAALPAGGQAAGNKALREVDTEYDTRLRALLRSRGLALRAGNLVECDMPVIVKRNIKILNPLALAFQELAAEKKYSEEDLVGAVVSLVQTAIRYKIPPPLENGLHTGGLLPPARALLSGWGDCDTKTGLLAAILGSWNGMRMVGIAVPGHYLMAIRRIPGKGDLFVRYEGLEYVLVEPAGPAWLEPGQVGARTRELLAGRDGYKVEPFF